MALPGFPSRPARERAPSVGEQIVENVSGTGEAWHRVPSSEVVIGQGMRCVQRRREILPIRPLITKSKTLHDAGTSRPPSQTAGARISIVWVACVMGHGSPTGSHRIALMQGMQTPPECCGQVPALASLGDL